MNSFPKITFCTGVGTVTGANFLLEVSSKTKILIDCGMVQGEKFATAENREPFSYDISSITALFITHAHLDHVGRIPKLVKDGYKGPIYSTPETQALAEVVLNDAVNILKEEADREGVSPLYDASDVQQVFPLWKTVNYHEPFKLNDEVSIYLKDAGHILGSAMIEVTLLNGATGADSGSPLAHSALTGTTSGRSQTKILFTGDLGNSPAPLLRDTEAVGDVDYLVMESVYGDRNHEDREGRTNKFKQVIERTIARGGTLIIPAFAIDRTQVLLYELNNMVEKGVIPSIPIFVDSPMAIKATDIYKTGEHLFNNFVQAQIRAGDDIFKFPRLKYTVSQNQSQEIDNAKPPKIILAGSGMSVGGRVVGHEEQYLPDGRNTVLLVGYQTTGSLGRQLVDGLKKVHIHRKTIKVKAHIETLFGYSAHKDGDHLVQFVSTAGDEKGKGRLKKVFTVMGEPGASMHLAQRINDELGVKALVPNRGEIYRLE